MAQVVKNLPAIWETWVRSLGQEDPLEKELATPSSILAWRIPWTEEPDSPWGHKESDTTEQLTHTQQVLYGSGWGNPHFWPPDEKSWLIGKDLGKLGNIEGKRRRGVQRIRWLDSITNGLNGPALEKTLGGSREGQGSVACCSSWEVTKSWTWLSDWITILTFHKVPPVEPVLCEPSSGDADKTSSEAESSLQIQSVLCYHLDRTH